MGPACMSEAAAATFHQECFGWRAASRAWKSAECTSTFWPRSACSPSPRGANAGDDPRETALIWPLMPSHLVDVRYFVSNREWNYRLRFRGRERERNAKKKRTRRGKNEYTFGPRAKYIRSCRKRMNYPCMARMKKRRGKKNRGENAEEKENCSLFRVGEKCIYNKKKIYILKCSKKKDVKKKNEETWSFAYGRPPESLASAEDNWITPLWSLYISA